MLYRLVVALLFFCAGPLVSAQTTYDIILRHGMVYDGMGRPPFAADVGILSDSIAFIGDLGLAKGTTEVDATEDPILFHLHGSRLEQHQVLSDVCWYDFDGTGRPVTHTAEHVALDYSVHEPTYRAGFSRRTANKACYLWDPKGSEYLTLGLAISFPQDWWRSEFQPISIDTSPPFLAQYTNLSNCWASVVLFSGHAGK